MRSTAFTCTGAQATLILPSGIVTYEVSGGRVLRQGQPLTELSGYGGASLAPVLPSRSPFPGERCPTSHPGYPAGGAFGDERLRA